MKICVVWRCHLSIGLRSTGCGCYLSHPRPPGDWASILLHRCTLFNKLQIQAKPKSILNRPKASNPPFSRCILPSLWNKTTCYQQTTGAQCALHVTTIYLEKSKETKRCDLQPPRNKRIMTRETETCALKERVSGEPTINWFLGFWVIPSLALEYSQTGRPAFHNCTQKGFLSSLLRKYIWVHCFHKWFPLSER